jgi:hypothetical protein
LKMLVCFPMPSVLSFCTSIIDQLVGRNTTSVPGAKR